MLKHTIATRYQSEILAGKKFDAIIIGSGVSGLATAALMAKQGKKVVVLEKHNKAGGFTHSFRRKGFEWDVGLHYVGDVGSDKSFGKRLLDYVSGGKIQWHKMEDPYDVAVFPDKNYEFISGREGFLENMSSYFPGERKALVAYLDLIQEALKTSDLFFGMKVLPPFLGNIGSYFFDKRFHRYSDKTVLEALLPVTQNQKLISVLCTQWGDYGLPPHKASFMVHAMVVNHYLRGGYFPKGGSKVIASHIIDTIRECGSDVYSRAEVDRLVIKKEQCHGVLLKNGDEIYADKVISSAGIFNTFDRFMGERSSQEMNDALARLDRSAAHVSLYLGLDKTAKELKLKNGNQWIFPSYSHQKNYSDFLRGKTEDFPVVYVSFPSAKDPLWEEEHPGTSTIDVISLMPFESVAQWDGTRWANRGDDYLALKEKLTDKLLKTTVEQNPGIEKHIVVKELSTPLSTKHFSCYQRGEIYGLSHCPQRFRQKALRPHTPIKNLYLTGQDIVSAGIMGAVSGALITSIAVLKKNLKSQI